jgi:hypothetical protein
LKSKFKDVIKTYCEGRVCQCNSFHVNLNMLLDATYSLKEGKSTDQFGVSAKHYLNAPVLLFKLLVDLSNQMLLHSFVPSEFKLGIVLPLVKDTSGDRSSIQNYRGITISPIFTKIFEHLIRILFEPFLTTSHCQFGYKKKSSTSHAVFCLKKTVDYYLSKSNSVFCAFLDASKALIVWYMRVYS